MIIESFVFLIIAYTDLKPRGLGAEDISVPNNQNSVYCDFGENTPIKCGYFSERDRRGEIQQISDRLPEGNKIVRDYVLRKGYSENSTGYLSEMDGKMVFSMKTPNGVAKVWSVVPVEEYNRLLVFEAIVKLSILGVAGFMTWLVFVPKKKKNPFN